MRTFSLLMCRLIKYFLVLVICVPNLVSAQEGNSEELIDTPVSQEWLVVLDDPRPARLQGWVRSRYGKGSGDYRGALEFERFGRSVASKYNMELHDQWFIPSLGVYCLVVRFKEGQDKTIAALRLDKSVQWVQPSNEFELLSSPTTSSQANLSQADKTNYATVKQNVDGAGVVIAVIDSEIDDSHQDLTGQIDKVGDFVVAAKRGAAFGQKKTGESHGTAIAGVMIADRNTKLGVAGIAPAATLQAYRGCWEDSNTDQTNCNTLSLARALDAVLDSQVDILNLSLSGPKDLLLERLLQRIINRGSIVVTAFDPSRPSNSRFPNARDGVLIVRAEGLDKQHSTLFTAPGARVVASPGNSYNFMHGHSVATAYTSGLLALRKQALDSGRNLGIENKDWRQISDGGTAKELLNDILDRS